MLGKGLVDAVQGSELRTTATSHNIPMDSGVGLNALYALVGKPLAGSATLTTLSTINRPDGTLNAVLVKCVKDQYFVVAPGATSTVAIIYFNDRALAKLLVQTGAHEVTA